MKSSLIVATALALSLNSAALPQPGAPDPQRAQRNGFAASGLKAGSLFPAVDIYDTEGKPFNTRSLKGKYTVIVNGCLT